MKYVKIYNEKMQCLGVADIEQNYDKDGYVKLFDATTMKFQGVVDVDDIPESGDNMPVVKVFDENMQPCGVVTADNIRHSDGYLIRLQKDPSTTGAVTGGGRFIAGTSVTVVATPDAQSDYPEFDGWYEGETKVSENASYTFTVSGARTLVAKFKEATPTPIEPDGDAQVFKNQYCSEYIDGAINLDHVYVRINNVNSVGWPMVGVGDTNTILDKSGTGFENVSLMLRHTQAAYDTESREISLEEGGVYRLDKVIDNDYRIANVYNYNDD